MRSGVCSHSMRLGDQAGGRVDKVNNDQAQEEKISNKELDK